MKFLGRVFSFATDSDGLSLKDIVTIVVLLIWSTVIVTGLVNDYTGVKLDQFSMILDSSTELTVYVIVATLGLVATDNIASMLNRIKNNNSIKKKDNEVLTEFEVFEQEKAYTSNETENKTDVRRSEDII